MGVHWNRYQIQLNVQDPVKEERSLTVYVLFKEQPLQLRLSGVGSKTIFIEVSFAQQ